MSVLNLDGARSGWRRIGIVAPLFWAAAIFSTGPILCETYKIKLTDKPPYATPPVLEVKVGDTVVWENEGPELVHTITDEKLTLWSGDVKIQTDWNYTFKKAGVYPYLCFRHNFMRGTVIVRNADGSTQSAPDFAYQGAFAEHVVPTMRSVPRMVIQSRVDDSIWFTEGGGDFYGFEDIPAQNKIGRLDEQGHFVEFATPTPGGDGSKVGVDSLVMDDGGNVWFTERLTNRIGKLAPGGKIDEFQLANPKGYALGVDIDRAGKVWFAERYNNRIGWIRPNGEIKEIELPEKESEPRTIFIDSKQRAWYTARTANEIGYYDPDADRIVRLKIPTENARPTGICETSDGTIWFVEMVGNKVAKVVGEQIIEYPVPTPFSAPFKIAAAPDGNIWFTQVFGNSIGRLDPRTGNILELKIPTVDSRPGGIAVDRKGRVWFAEQMGNKIAMFDPQKAAEVDPTVAAAFRGATAGEKTAASVEPPAEAPSAGREIRDFAVPTEGGGPGNDIVEGPGRWLWFNELFGNRIGSFQIDSHEFREYAIPGEVNMPTGLVRDADGALWTTLFRSNAIARLDPATGAFEKFALPTDAALPAGIAETETGDIWITELGANRIARFDRAAKTFEEHELPRPGASPLMIAADRKGKLYVSATEENGNFVARFELASRSWQVLPMPTENASPTGLLVDGDRLWVAEGGAGKLARLDLPTGKWAEFPIPAEKAEPVKLAKDRRGRIWLTDGGGLGGVGGNRLAVFDPASEKFELIAMTRGGAKPRGITVASDGNVWFTQQNANLISRIAMEGEPPHGTD